MADRCVCSLCGDDMRRDHYGRHMMSHRGEVPRMWHIQCHEAKTERNVCVYHRKYENSKGNERYVTTFATCLVCGAYEQNMVKGERDGNVNPRNGWRYKYERWCNVCKKPSAGKLEEGVEEREEWCKCLTIPPKQNVTLSKCDELIQKHNRTCCHGYEAIVDIYDTKKPCPVLPSVAKKTERSNAKPKAKAERKVLAKPEAVPGNTITCEKLAKMFQPDFAFYFYETEEEEDPDMVEQRQEWRTSERSLTVDKMLRVIKKTYDKQRLMLEKALTAKIDRTET